MIKRGQFVNAYHRDDKGGWHWIASGTVENIGSHFARVRGRSNEHAVNEEFPLSSANARIVPIQ